MTSPDNTRIGTPSTIVDGAVVWSIRSDTVVLRSAVATNGHATSLLSFNGAIYALSPNNLKWWRWIGNNSWKNVGADPSAGAGSRIGPPATIIDAAGVVWSIRSDAAVLSNAVATNGHATALLWFGGAIYELSLAGAHWFKWLGSNTWQDVGTADPSVVIVPPPPAPTITLTATPTSILQGAKTLLTWVSTNAVSVSIDQGIGTVSLNGSLSVIPAASESYTATAHAASGALVTAQASVIVTAIVPNPTITGFAVTPSSVTAGQSVVLSATITNATQVTLDGAPITLPFTHTPTVSRSYQIVATGAAGTTPASSPSIAVTVTAIAPPPPPLVTQSVFKAYAMPTDIDAGISYGGGIKHVTPCFCPTDNRIYFNNGDYANPAPYAGESYQQCVKSVDLAVRMASNDPNAGWRKEYSYEGFGGTSVQPKHWDYCGLFYWPQQKLLVGVPGQLGDTTQQAPGETSAKVDDPCFIRDDVMTFDPTKRMQAGAWQRFNSGIAWEGYGWDSWFVIPDMVKQTVTRFGVQGPSRQTLDLATQTWGGVVNLPLGPNGKAMAIWKDYFANDAVGRRTFVLDALNAQTYRMDWDSLTPVPVAPFPGALESTPAPNHTHIVWNEKWKVVEYLSIFDGHFYWLDPDGLYGAANIWHDSGVAVSDPVGLNVQCRVACRDPVNDVSIWFGGVDVPNPYLFVFRFSATAVTPTPVPVPIPTPIPTPVPTPIPTPVPTPTGTAAWLTGKAINEWVSIPNTRQADGDLSALTTAGLADGTHGNVLAGAFVFGGGALKKAGSQLLIWSGGGGDWAGNEVRGLRLEDDAPKWSVVIPPSPAAQMDTFAAQTIEMYYHDGKPGAAHSYYSPQFINSLDTLMLFTRIHTWPTDRGGSKVVDGVNMGTGAWSTFGSCWFDFNWDGPGQCQHPVTEEVFRTSAYAIQAWRSGAWAETVCNEQTTSVLDKCVLAAGGDVLLRLGLWGNDATTVRAHTLSVSAPRPTSFVPIALTGPAAAEINQWDGVGLEWDAGIRKFVYFNDNGILYTIDPVGWVVTRLTTTGTAPVAGAARKNGGGSGIYGRMRYVPNLKGIVIAQTSDANAYFVRTA